MVCFWLENYAASVNVEYLLAGDLIKLHADFFPMDLNFYLARTSLLNMHVCLYLTQKILALDALAAKYMRTCK
jgi:hypothetical protein